MKGLLTEKLSPLQAFAVTILEKKDRRTLGLLSCNPSSQAIFTGMGSHSKLPERSPPGSRPEGDE